MKQGKWVSLLMTFVMTISLASCGAPSAQTTLPPETSAPVETGQPVEGNYPVTVQVYDENGTLYAETFEKSTGTGRVQSASGNPASVSTGTGRPDCGGL